MKSQIICLINAYFIHHINDNTLLAHQPHYHLPNTSYYAGFHSYSISCHIILFTSLSIAHAHYHINAYTLPLYQYRFHTIILTLTNTWHTLVPHIYILVHINILSYLSPHIHFIHYLHVSYHLHVDIRVYIFITLCLLPIIHQALMPIIIYTYPLFIH